MVNVSTSASEGGSNDRATDQVERSHLKGSTTTSGSSATPSFPPPKTDKPRPHICTTCTRSFARLEHLKRHERSHTKEKPFQCSECTRCFARRDLLLRHQQKLHSSTTPSSRPRSGRRESVAGVQAGRVRKNSVAGANTAAMRPRANTLSHVDSARLGMLAQSSSNLDRTVSPALNRQHFGGINEFSNFQYRNVAHNHHHSVPTLPKLTTGLPADIASGLRTAPPFGGFGGEYGMNMFDFGTSNANTINPHALHMDGIQGLAFDSTASPFQQYYGGFMTGQAAYDDEDNLGWMARGFENQMSFAPNNDNAIDDSSPSAMSTNSPAAPSDLMLDNNHSLGQNFYPNPHVRWQNQLTGQNEILNNHMNIEYGMGPYSDYLSAANGTMSPESLLVQNGLGMELNFPTPPDLSSTEFGPPVPEFNGPTFHLPLNKHAGTSSASTSSIDSSLRQSYSSITTASGDLVNDQVRNSLLAGLSQSAGYSHHKHSQPSTSSPLSPNSGYRGKAISVSSCPSTQDLQRYISAYVQYFHPHLPFLHIPTLSFESLDHSMPISPIDSPMYSSTHPVANGRSCLVLSMAAIGALYEHEMNNSKDLFESGKRLISCYLEERRKANLSRTQPGPNPPIEAEDTPLWLVQVMLLNVVYGHNCGDKTAAEIASNHCSALVSLARGAELARPRPPENAFPHCSPGGFPHGHMNGMAANAWNSMIIESDDSDWRLWKNVEERKRTLYAVFILSSLLVSAYNHPPAITNSEIRLELPCDEELWSADSALAWRSSGGSAIAESDGILFSAALGHLLTAAQRQKHRRNSGSQSSSVDESVADSASDLKPSSFGCLILVSALHNYIWETRQRHLGRQWTAHETEQMHAHIEPALKAWQAAWASNPSHSLERPNPFGAGPLSADSIPLLDLAYVRLFVNLGRSKEAFWQRDFDGMALELARSTEVMPKEELRGHMNGEMRPPPRRPSHSSFTLPHDVPTNTLSAIKSEGDSCDPSRSGPAESPGSAIPATRRERHLRKAAFYAADSLLMSGKLGLTFADQDSRELPMQSAMCAFDCAQVLAEWVTTLQERVGKYLGIIGRDTINLFQVPGIMLLEDQDRGLLQKIGEILEGVKHKMSAGSGQPQVPGDGYGGQILKATAHVLDRSAVWPVTKLMARSLETQAVHMQERADRSISTHV